ncbi:replication-relaxation family protein [Effusibacillus pohliae]|uniref:replication-relaxation family protein n=1 Tax=Effusibacillus pohliae TaxID=232270 RepID=UPI00035F1BC9|nr:replication-relaxation family protein [Effusibacillus pohliae]
MIFRWLDHPSFHRDEQLIAILYDLGMATKKQLLAITGWHPRTLKERLKQIRKRGNTLEEKDLWLKTFTIPGQVRDVAYSLGRLGMEYAQEMALQIHRVKEAPQAQVAHYLGINDILVRLLVHGYARERIAWLTSTEATDVLLRYWEREVDRKIDRRDLIRPDARLILDDTRRFWIEYDNNTENPRQLERKFHNYVNTLMPIGETSPVVWVALTQNRRDYLKANWNAFVELFYRDKQTPQMYFFTPGEETKFFLSE